MSGVLLIAPSPVNVPPTRAGQSSVRSTFVLRNAGDAPLTVTALGVTGPFAVFPSSLPIVLGPGAAAAVDITVTPPVVGPVTGVLSVTHTAPGSPGTANLVSAGTAATLLSEHNRALNTADGLRFFLEATLPTQGDLPHRYAFTVQTQNRLDPKADVLLRLANVADLTTLPLGRDQALLSSPAEVITYLAATWTFVYPDLVTATAAKDSLLTRLSQLVRDWVTYRDGFRADPVPLTLPLPASELALLEAAVDAYRAAKQGRRARQDILTANTAARVNADLALADAQAKLQLAQSLFSDTGTGDGAAARSAEMTEATQALGQLIAASNAYYAVSTSAPAPDRATFSANIAIAQVGYAGAQAGQTNHSAYATRAQNARNDALSARDAAQVADTAARASERTASDALTAALAAEAKALAAVLVLCPNFDASTVCECPG